MSEMDSDDVSYLFLAEKERYKESVEKSKDEHLNTLLANVLTDQFDEIFNDIEVHLVDEWLECQIRLNWWHEGCGRDKLWLEWWVGRSKMIEDMVYHIKEEYGLTFSKFTKSIPRYSEMSPKVREVYREYFGNPYKCDTCSHREFPETDIVSEGQNIKCKKEGWVFNRCECKNYNYVQRRS